MKIASKTPQNGQVTNIDPKDLSDDLSEKFINTLRMRFEKNMQRHESVAWQSVHSKLETYPQKLANLFVMEQTGGEPDVVTFDTNSRELVFCDCSEQSPIGRRSVCYDQKAQEERDLASRPAYNALEMAETMGIEILTEEQYRKLQTLGKFDTKTSSWVKTPKNIRALGGAIFCDRRYDTVFVYHNGAESYYAARGFRGSLQI